MLLIPYLLNNPYNPTMSIHLYLKSHLVLIVLSNVLSPIMVMMNLCSDSGEQSESKMNECRLVADRMREAGRCDRSELGKLENSKRLSNEAPAHPISSYEGTPSSRNCLARPEQDPDQYSLEEGTCPGGGCDPERRTRLIELRRPRSLRRIKQSTRREEEKPEAARRAAMAERTSPTLNGHFCRKLRRKERRSRIGARPSALRAKITLSRYLRIPPLSSHAQKSYLMPPGKAPCRDV
jgi:hypothetical protein